MADLIGAAVSLVRLVFILLILRSSWRMMRQLHSELMGEQYDEGYDRGFADGLEAAETNGKSISSDVEN